MKNTPPIASRAVFAWTAVLTVLLATFAFVTILTNSKSETIKDNIQVLQLEKDNYHKIDTCISLLYSAENNSRFFVVTQDSAYINAYTDQLQAVIAILDQYETEREGRSKSITRLISSKQRKNEEFVNLRMMVDSLLSFSLTNPQAHAVLPDRPVRKVHTTSKAEKTDTIEVTSKRSKKNLVKRIMDAIRDKDAADISNSRINSNTITKHDSLKISLQPLPLQNYSLLERARRELSVAEQQLLSINSQIFVNLQNSLRELKNSEEQNIKTLRESLLASTQSTFEEMSVLIWGSVILVMLLAVMIIWNLIKLYKKDVTIIRYANLTADITKRKADFMAQITHEIRTPLNSIIGFSNLIDTSKINQDLRVNIDSIKSASQILLTLVNEILDLSKFESGKIALQDKPFQPVLLVEEVVSMLSVLANEKKIVISTRFEMDRGITLNGDNFRIKQIVTNLLTNAIKFTPESGHVVVSLNFDKENHNKGILRINIKDSGVGIAKEHLGSIFEDFVQVGNSDSKSRQMGTGLGLAICKRIVELYGGKIKVESVLGEGSEFIVNIPLKLVIPIMAVNAVTQSTPGKILEGKKVLIADDTKMNLLLISRIMDRLGAFCDLVDNGQKAFELFESNMYDLIITDINMPVMDGVELTKRIRGYDKKEKARIPVLGFTGNTSDENMALYMEIGMDDVLPKPFDENHFIDVLKRVFVIN